MARAGYQSLFQIRSDDAEYAATRHAELKFHAAGIDNAIIGVHVRRGDRHPFSPTYSLGYLPQRFYRDPAEDMASLFASSKIILASDDPEIYARGELAKYARAQERITLASKSSKALKEGSVGWEGGFFKDLFWDLGLPAQAHELKRQGSPLPTRQQGKTTKGGKGHVHESLPKDGKDGKGVVMRDYRANPTPEAQKLREFIGRAYLLELSILGQSDRVVCAVSSYTCRILAVMMGWERAFERGHWKNVDGGYTWRALDV
jgi:hypothetical protein